jgi:hypothetical protein
MKTAEIIEISLHETHAKLQNGAAMKKSAVTSTPAAGGHKYCIAFHAHVALAHRVSAAEIIECTNVAIQMGGSPSCMARTRSKRSNSSSTRKNKACHHPKFNVMKGSVACFIIRGGPELCLCR